MLNYNRELRRSKMRQKWKVARRVWRTHFERKIKDKDKV